MTSKPEKTAYEKLTKKQRLFVDKYLETCSVLESAKYADYCPTGTEETKRKEGYKALNSEKVRQAITEFHAERQKDIDTRLYINRRKLEGIRDDENKDTKDQLSAINMLVKMDAGFIDKTELGGPGGRDLVFNIIQPETNEPDNSQLETDPEPVESSEDSSDARGQ